MEQAKEKKWDQLGEALKALLAETHLEVWRQFQLFVEKERPREHQAHGLEAAGEGEMVGPPPKKTKYEKSEEATGNVQEESVGYNKLYSTFSQRALDTIRNQFAIIHNWIDDHGMFSQTERIRLTTGYIDMLQKIFTLVQQIEEKDKRIKKND